MAAVVATATAIVVLTYRAATSDGVVADKVSIAVGAGGMMAGIVATILAKIQESDADRRHRESIAALTGMAERQSEAFKEALTALQEILKEVRSTTETNRAALKEVIREVNREELTAIDSAAMLDREILRETPNLGGQE